MSEFLSLYSSFESKPSFYWESLMKELDAEEAQLQFKSLDSSDALALGLAILSESPRALNPADKTLRGVVVHVSVNGHLLFYHAQDGTAADNFEWIARKVATVSRFGHSSLYMGTSCSKPDTTTTLDAKFMLPANQFAGVGGGFPIRVPGVVYPIGVVAVSGLPHHLDHDLLLRGIRKYLDSK